MVLTLKPDSLAVLHAENARLVALLEDSVIDWKAPSPLGPEPISSREDETLICIDLSNVTDLVDIFLLGLLTQCAERRAGNEGESLKTL